MTVSGKGARRKGINYERTILNHATTNGIDATNLNRSGHPGTDQLWHGTHLDLHIEIKNQAKLNLAGWVDQANTDADGQPAAVIIKRRLRTDPNDAYITMDLATFIHLWNTLNNEP